jgi:hypothetical protein
MGVGEGWADARRRAARMERERASFCFLFVASVKKRGEKHSLMKERERKKKK